MGALQLEGFSRHVDICCERARFFGRYILSMRNISWLQDICRISGITPGQLERARAKARGFDNNDARYTTGRGTSRSRMRQFIHGLKRPGARVACEIGAALAIENVPASIVRAAWELDQRAEAVAICGMASTMRLTDDEKSTLTAAIHARIIPDYPMSWGEGKMVRQRLADAGQVTILNALIKRDDFDADVFSALFSQTDDLTEYTDIWAKAWSEWRLDPSAERLPPRWRAVYLRLRPEAFGSVDGRCGSGSNSPFKWQRNYGLLLWLFE